MGPRGTPLRHCDHLVSHWGRSLYGLYIHCRSGARLWRGSSRVLCGTLHDCRLPDLFLVFPRIWYVCHKHQYITAGDFVRGRFGSRWLALAVTVTGIVATMPYIALQLVGLQVVIGGLGISGTGLA